MRQAPKCADRRLAVVKRHPEFAARALREVAEQTMVAGVIEVLFEKIPGATVW
jgi:hypothetical protein